MKRILLACVALWVSGASAAELATPQLYRPTPVVSQRLYEWTGLYFGVNAGYGWGNADSTVTFTPGLIGGTTTPLGLGPTELTGTILHGTGRLSGALAGGQGGFNFQWARIVVGMEIDGQWSGQRGSFAATCSIGCAASLSPRIKAIVTARGRVGYDFDGIMPYVTVGGAMVNVADDLAMTVAGVSASFPSMPATVLGWVAGGGVELGLWSNWSAKLEYLHIGANNVAAGAPIPNALGVGTANEGAGYQDNIVRVGLNYRFGPSGGGGLLTARPAYAMGDARSAYALSSIDLHSMESYVAPRPAKPAPQQAAAPSAAPQAPAQAVPQASAQVASAAAMPVASRASVSEPEAAPDALESRASARPATTAGMIELPKLPGYDTADAEHSRPRREKKEDDGLRLKKIMSICQGC
jgi:opacity protein-like surface antigen